jgi:hypothetical protein
VAKRTPEGLPLCRKCGKIKKMGWCEPCQAIVEIYSKNLCPKHYQRQWKKEVSRRYSQVPQVA